MADRWGRRKRGGRAAVAAVVVENLRAATGIGWGAQG